MRRFRAHYAIVSLGGLHLEGGLMDFHPEEAEFCREVIAASGRVIAVADVSKFRNQAPVKVCDLGELDTLVTDRAPPEPFAERLRDQEVELLIAE